MMTASVFVWYQGSARYWSHAPIDLLDGQPLPTSNLLAIAHYAVWDCQAEFSLPTLIWEGPDRHCSHNAARK